MCPLMVALQADVLHGDYGYPPGEEGVRRLRPHGERCTVTEQSL